MLPSSLCHLPRSAPLNANHKAVACARRGAAFGIGRPTHRPSLYSYEKRPARLVVAHSETEEQEGAVVSEEQDRDAAQEMPRTSGAPLTTLGEW